MMINLPKRSACLLATAALAGAAVALPATAEDNYPDKPVSVIVAYSPGGATDFQARLVTMMAQDSLGQPIVILNKPGAGGQVGWNYLVSQGKEDGYDLAAYNVPHFIAQSIMFDTQYNVDNLEPIANWGADPAVLIVNKDSEFNSAEELVEFAKSNPGKVTVSGAGLYVGHHIATLQLAKASGAEFKYVPTKGGVDALKYVLGGQVKAGFNNLSDAYRSRDRLKILAVADVQRNEEFLPDVPTFKELGIEVDDSSVNFRGLMTRKGVPEPVLETLAAKVPEMFEHPKTAKKMSEGGSPMRVLSRDEVREMWTSRQAYLTELLSDLKKQQ
jgi:tripartite-type tricarboxylate transporter receptor subunit TctC